MTRMIERWFPCAEVSSNSDAGWGSGNPERNLFTWFAARPTAQAKAAVICSLLPWPEDNAEQKRLQALVRRAMTGRYAEWQAVRAEILRHNGNDVRVLDPFSGRGIIPLEAARLGIPSSAVDYSPVATLASHILVDFPFLDWSAEPEIPYPNPKGPKVDLAGHRLLDDVEKVLHEVGRRHRYAMEEFFPAVDGKASPWGYLWAVTLPCQECGRRFPLIGAYALRKAGVRKARGRRPEFRDIGQSFYIDAHRASGEFWPVVHSGPPKRTPTLASAQDSGGRKAKGKSAICPFCDHPHPLDTHQRLAGEGLGRDVLLVVAENDDDVGRRYRAPTEVELAAAEQASKALKDVARFNPLLPAVPDEQIPLNNGATIRPQLYGAKTYGDLMCERQTMSFVRLCQAISEIARELRDVHGVSNEYVPER